jgi:hypothetical protein
MVGAVALALLGQQPMPAQGSSGQATPSQTGQQSQGIPDAPRPQSVPLGTVAPGKGTPASGTPQPAGTVPTDTDQSPVGTKLPETPITVDKDAGAPPEVLGASDYAGFTLHVQSNFVDIPFTVKDRKNGLVAGLTWRDVRVYENGVRQHMAVFTSDPVPMAVALVIDQSMPYDAMNRVNASLGALTGAFAPYDEVAVFTYNNGPKMQVGYTAGQGAVLSAVLERSKGTGREPMYYNAGEALGGGININNGAEANITPLTSNAPGGPNRVQQVPRDVHTLNDAILAADYLCHLRRQGVWQHRQDQGRDPLPAGEQDPGECDADRRLQRERTGIPGQVPPAAVHAG